MAINEGNLRQMEKNRALRDSMYTISYLSWKMPHTHTHIPLPRSMPCVMLAGYSLVAWGSPTPNCFSKSHEVCDGRQRSRHSWKWQFYPQPIVVDPDWVGSYTWKTSACFEKVFLYWEILRCSWWGRQIILDVFHDFVLSRTIQ